MKVLGRLIPTPNQLSCRQVGRILQTYLDDELDDAAAGKVAAHLEDCRRCGLDARGYRDLKFALERRRPAPDTDALERLRVFGQRLVEGDESTR